MSEINITACYKVFSRTFKNVGKALNINDPESREYFNYVSSRTLIIFKFDLMLFDYKEKHDKKRVILRGKNALTHFLVNEKNIDFNQAKNISLNDALIIAWDNIRTYELSDEVLFYLKKDYTFDDEEFSEMHTKYPSFSDDEWDANLLDERLR